MGLESNGNRYEGFLTCFGDRTDRWGISTNIGCTQWWYDTGSVPGPCTPYARSSRRRSDHSVSRNIDVDGFWRTANIDRRGRRGSGGWTTDDRVRFRGTVVVVVVIVIVVHKRTAYDSIWLVCSASIDNSSSRI